MTVKDGLRRASMAKPGQKVVKGFGFNFVMPEGYEPGNNIYREDDDPFLRMLKEKSFSKGKLPEDHNQSRRTSAKSEDEPDEPPPESEPDEPPPDSEPDEPPPPEKPSSSLKFSVLDQIKTGTQLRRVQPPQPKINVRNAMLMTIAGGKFDLKKAEPVEKVPEKQSEAVKKLMRNRELIVGNSDSESSSGSDFSDEDYG